MGCDIHIHCEALRKGKWQKTGGFKTRYYDPKSKAKWFSRKTTDEPYEGRNYSLFAVLADVRNGPGFAGCDLGDKFTPISSPKGLPGNVSAEILKDSNDWGVDGHSHSWFLLSELVGFDWKGKINKHRGYIGIRHYPVFLKKGKPESWCGDVSGREVMKVSNRAAERILKDNLVNKASCYTQVEWQESYYESCKSFVDETIQLLKKKSRRKNLSDVRIVFWFDN